MSPLNGDQLTMWTKTVLSQRSSVHSGGTHWGILGTRACVSWLHSLEGGRTINSDHKLTQVLGGGWTWSCEPRSGSVTPVSHLSLLWVLRSLRAGDISWSYLSPWARLTGCKMQMTGTFFKNRGKCHQSHKNIKLPLWPLSWTLMVF